MKKFIRFITPLISLSSFVFSLIILFSYIDFNLASFILGIVLTVLCVVMMTYNKMKDANNIYKDLNNYK